MFFAIDIQKYKSKLRDLFDGVEESLSKNLCELEEYNFLSILNASMILGQAKELIVILDELEDSGVDREDIKNWCKKGLFLEAKIKSIAKGMGIIKVSV